MCIRDRPYSIKMDKDTQHLLNDAIDAWSPEEMSKTAILQVNSCYLVWEHRKNIYIADQHAVHERILYEQIKLGFYEKVAKNLPFTYPQPQKLSLSLTDTSLLEEYSSSLKTMGFQFKRQGDIWYVTSVPSFLKNRTMSDVISEILYHVSSESDDGKGTVLDYVTPVSYTHLAKDDQNYSNDKEKICEDCFDILCFHI